ncbi:hypothetical protein [uncultured Shewanella sp.]|nr:hypothetical protein [uncultured Shewanella sp.]
MNNTTSFVEHTTDNCAKLAIDNSAKPIIARFPKVSDSATSMVVVE